ncbi:hypothetical protein [Polymorphospora lycopeni]|uniref:Uncharacterized protein n=1 Tax=Polymorphospora lycopeni TaxID=3140240 RepID=A0ABV5CJD7_9ACTN
MGRGPKSGGGSARLDAIRNGTKRRRVAFAMRAEELAAQLGVLVGRKAAKAGRKRPLRTERGGQHATRSAGAVTRGVKGTRMSRRNGRKLGLGRKRVSPV